MNYKNRLPQVSLEPMVNMAGSVYSNRQSSGLVTKYNCYLVSTNNQVAITNKIIKYKYWCIFKIFS